VLAGRLGLGRLAGDSKIDRGGVTIFIRLASMFLLSVVLSPFVGLVRGL
jgi:DUF2905 family protein